ncbi:hypothetical protein [Acidimangrovimonas pyrenivorans]|uniref:Uncharacterized protein n=1 Tax=Acidimangrovimonas pyrenivorans TaxID=2030798 RepID=A0ABV7AES2_9RHOB
MKSRLLNSTFLKSGRIAFNQGTAGAKSPGHTQKLARKVAVAPGQARGRGSTAFRFGEKIACPALSLRDIEGIDDTSAEYVTRHFKEDFIGGALRGYFRFGTIASYRPADMKQIGRFSDAQEGTQQETFRSRTGLYDDVAIGGNRILGTTIVGFDNPIVYEYVVNDYCSCSSSGKFDLARAKLLRERGNDDIGAYAVYDLKKLRQAIEDLILEKAETNDLVLIGRDVVYGSKDRHWEIEERFEYAASKDRLAVWLGTAFVKSKDYMHEEEVRMLLIDPRNAGGLDERAEPLEFEDPRIAAAVIDHGRF